MLDALEALNFDLHTFFLQLVNITLVVGVLSYFLFKPIGKVINEREERIANSLQEAEKSKKEAIALLSDYEKQVANAKEDAQEIVNKATKLGEDMQARIVGEAREEAARQLEKAKSEIMSEKAKALNEIKGEVADLVVLAAGKVIERELSLKDNEKMLNNLIKEVGKVQ